MKKSADVTVKPVESTDPLHFHEHFRGEHSPQPVYVELSLETGELSAYTSPDIGNGVPERIYSRRAVRWEIPVLTPAAVNALLDEIEPHAGIVLDGSDVVWDGHNHVGQHDDDAQDAVQTIADLCDEGRFSESDRASVRDAYDYLSPVGGDSVQSRIYRVTATTTDDELKTRADELTAEAAAENNHVHEADVLRFLTDLRGRLQQNEAN